MGGVDIGGGKGKDVSINLYPMLDIFSILICFLLMNYSTQGESVESRQGLELPRSEVRVSLDAAATATITKTDLVIQGAVEIKIGPDGDVPENFRYQGGIKQAYEVFKKLQDSNQTLRNRDQNLNLAASELNTLTLEADKNAQFKLFKRVMLSAQQADFVSWKLAVDKNHMD